MSLVSVPATTLWIAPDQPRAVDAPILEGDPAGWASAQDTVTRFGLHGRVHSQLLLGEPVEIVAEEGDWVEVSVPWQLRDGNGYRGWVPAAHITDGAVEPTSRWAVVTKPSANLAGRALSYATWLPVDSASEREVVVRTPQGPHVLDRNDVDVVEGGRPVDRIEVVETARQFVGLPYLWGGTTGWGFDCSGLVHAAYRRFGIALPRDADDQQAYADPVDLDDVQPGDLYFFASRDRVNHVGFATSPAGDGARLMLHAPEDSVFIEDGPMVPERVAQLVSAGRIDPSRGRLIP